MTQRSNMSIVDRTCPSCGHHNKDHRGGTIINELAGLPAGVKFDSSDQELLQDLEAKVGSDDIQKLHPLINDFIPTLESQNGICSTHSHKLPEASTEESGVFV